LSSIPDDDGATAAVKDDDVEPAQKKPRLTKAKQIQELTSARELYNKVADLRVLSLLSLVRWCGRPEGKKSDEEIYFIHQQEVLSIEEENIDPSRSNDSRSRINVLLDMVPKNFALLASDMFLKGTKLQISTSLGMKDIFSKLFDIVMNTPISKPYVYTSMLRKLGAVRDNLTKYEPIHTVAAATDSPNERGVDGKVITGLLDRVYTVPFHGQIELFRAQKSALSSFDRY